MSSKTNKRLPEFDLPIENIKNEQLQQGFEEFLSLIQKHLVKDDIVKMLQSTDSGDFVDAVYAEGKNNLVQQVFVMSVHGGDEERKEFDNRLSAVVKPLQDLDQGTDKVEIPELSVRKIREFVEGKEKEDENYVLGAMKKEIHEQVVQTLSVDAHASEIGRIAKNDYESVAQVYDTMNRILEKMSNADGISEIDLQASLTLHKELTDFVALFTSEEDYEERGPGGELGYEAIKAILASWDEVYKNYDDQEQLQALRSTLSMRRSKIVEEKLRSHEKVSSATDLAQDLQKHLSMLEKQLRIKNQNLKLLESASDYITTILVDFAILYHQPEVVRAKLDPSPDDLKVRAIELVHEFNKIVEDSKKTHVIPGGETLSIIDDVDAEITSIEGLLGVFSSVLVNRIDTSQERQDQLDEDLNEIENMMKEFDIK